MFIYLLTCDKTSLRYVGKTTQPKLKLRWQQHCYEAKYGSAFPLHVAIREHGAESFSLAVLYRATCPIKLAEQEFYWTDKLKTHLPEFGYNKKKATRFSQSLKV